jgi:SAM-dependent methyltransferase
VAHTTSPKFLLLRALRFSGLLPAADRAKFLVSRARVEAANRRFEAANPGFAMPPQHLAFDALNHVDWARYRSTGLAHAGLFARIVREHTASGVSLKILEWGCGPGRLIRHLPGLLTQPSADGSAPRTVQVHGSDYNAESIAWCQANLPQATFTLNGLNPPLPFADGEFDVTYNFSVFTHLSETVQLAWAQELKRVLKPGGLLICTTHGDAYRHLLASESERRAYAEGRLVEQGRYREGRKWFLAVHPPAFVRERLLVGWADVQRYNPRAEEGIEQDVWLARKPHAAAAAAAAAAVAAR